MEKLSKIFSEEIDEESISKWLGQFKPDEIPLIEKLILNFKYFGSKKVNEKLKLLYNTILVNNPNRDILFIPVGYVARSGAAVAYFFRVQNNLNPSKFTTVQDLALKQVSANSLIVLLDDFMGTGSQSVRVVDNVKEELRKININAKIAYAIISGLSAGVENFEIKTGCKVYVGEVITEEELPFSQNSKVFKNETEKEAVRTIVLKYGKQLFKEYPLGYKNAGALIGFFYSTPNNTLPIFWGSSQEWIQLLPYSESIKDSYSLIGPPIGVDQASLTTQENRPIIETKNLLEYDLPEELVSVAIQEFHSLPIVLMLAPILKFYEISFLTFNSLLHIIRELKHFQHEKESVCCSLSVLKDPKISQLEDKIFVQTSNKTTIHNHKEVIALSQLIEGYSGTVLLNTNGEVCGVCTYDRVENMVDTFLIQKYNQSASFSVRNNAIVLLFEGEGRIVIFHNGQRILSHRGASWHLHTSELSRVINVLSVHHLIDKLILTDLFRLSFKMSNKGKGGLITIGDQEHVIKMTEHKKNKFLSWKLLRINHSSDESLIGLFSQDGATIITNEGDVVDSMVQLQPDAGIVCEEEVDKGMKHKTAGKVSAATNAIAIAISVDGRITVFAKGKIVFKMMG